MQNDVQLCTRAFRGACHPAPRFSSAVVPPKTLHCVPRTTCNAHRRPVERMAHEEA